ncbi:MAG: ATP synthase protein I, partial [uncultured Blastococcus sp.]
RRRSGAPVTRPGGATGSDAPWDISFLRPGLLATAAAAAVAAPVAGVVGGWGSAVAVLAGAATVAAFFCVSAVVIAKAGRIDDSLALPAALGTFLVKALVLFAVLGGVPEDGWLDRLTLAWTVIAAALLWSAVQMRWVWTRQLYYAPPPAPPAGSDRLPRSDPEKPASRS